jgi:hypothetical protein
MIRKMEEINKNIVVNVKEKKIRWVEKIKYEMKKSEIEGSKVVVI